MILSVSPSRFKVSIGDRIAIMYSESTFTDKANLQFSVRVYPIDTTEWESPHENEIFTDDDRQAVLCEVISYLTERNTPYEIVKKLTDNKYEIVKTLTEYK